MHDYAGYSNFIVTDDKGTGNPIQSAWDDGDEKEGEQEENSGYGRCSVGLDINDTAKFRFRSTMNNPTIRRLQLVRRSEDDPRKRNTTR